MRLALLLAALLLANTLGGSCDCGDGLQSLEADIAVEPEALAFSRCRVGAPTEGRVQIGNRGTGRLTLTARVEPGAGTAEGVFVARAPADVRNGLAEDATVTFTPPAQGLFAADLVLVSNDPDTPELRVPLTGEGGPPELTISPSPIDLGRVNENDPRAQEVTLTNTGFDALAITGAALRDAGEGAGFALEAGALPATLAPGASAAITVSLAVDAAVAARADAERRLEDELVVTHADGEGTALVRAQINLAPVAVAVEQVTRRARVKVTVGRRIDVDGSETADPEGDPFTFTWTLAARPEASSAALIGQGAPGVQIVPDVPGRYVVNLRAVDAFGAVGEAQLEILPRDLTVVLTWEGSDSDLDLHLVRPGGVLGDYGACPGGCSEAQCNEVTDENPGCRSTGTDCAFANRAPEWGAPGRADDPRLDIDDVGGEGPEIISADEPEDGIWRVVVHACQDAAAGTSNATVRLLEAGVEVFASGPEPLAEDDAWSAVTLIREGGAWTSFIPGPGIVESQPTLCD